MHPIDDDFPACRVNHVVAPRSDKDRYAVDRWDTAAVVARAFTVLTDPQLRVAGAPLRAPKLGARGDKAVVHAAEIRGLHCTRRCRDLAAAPRRVSRDTIAILS